VSRESPDCPALGVAKPVSSELERVWVPTEEGPAAGRHESINALPKCARSPLSSAKRPPLRKTYRPPRSCPSRSLQVGTRARAQLRALHSPAMTENDRLRGAPTGRRPTECPYRVLPTLECRQRSQLLAHARPAARVAQRLEPRAPRFSVVTSTGCEDTQSLENIRFQRNAHSTAMSAICGLSPRFRG
jgi:hypothetical protein